MILKIKIVIIINQKGLLYSCEIKHIYIQVDPPNSAHFFPRVVVALYSLTKLGLTDSNFIVSFKTVLKHFCKTVSTIKRRIKYQYFLNQENVKKISDNLLISADKVG